MGAFDYVLCSVKKDLHTVYIAFIMELEAWGFRV